MKNLSECQVKKRGVAMPEAQDETLLEALLDSWDRNNTILVNLLGALPEGGLEARAMEGSPSVAEMFTHIHYVRLVFVSEDAPEFATEVRKEEWVNERDPGRITQMLNQSAKVVRDAVKSKVGTGGDMQLHYDHPVLLLQHMLWHEGYHHGQIKLALKLAGRPIPNKKAGPLTWRVWMDKTGTGPAQ
jgi:uncharacterized damage-inducible protein DinB